MLCQLCSKEIEIFSVGNCNHPICYECATKLRVFQDSKLCTVCGYKAPVVVFTDTINSYENLYERTNEHLFITKYNIAFQDDRSYDAFQNLMYRACWNCPMNPFLSSSLADHMREKHELFCCEFCSKKIEKFTISQKHSNTPYKFYKIRQFHIIRERYMNREDLFIHMLMVHRFCHICLAKDKQYVNGYHEEENLRQHFKRDHYLCEDGDCAIGKSAFDSAAALRDHKMKIHVLPSCPIPIFVPWTTMNRNSFSIFSSNQSGVSRSSPRQSWSQNRTTANAGTIKKKFSCMTIKGLYRLTARQKANDVEVTMMNWRPEGEIATTELQPSITSYIYAPRIPFVISTTAPEHMIKSDDILSKAELIRSEFRVYFAWNDTMLDLAAEKVGHLLFSSGSNNQYHHTILLTRVLLVPELKINVLSAKRLVEDGFDLIYTADNIRIVDPMTEDVLFEGKGENGFWKIQLECHEITKEIAKKCTPLEIYEVESEKQFSLTNFWNR